MTDILNAIKTINPNAKVSVNADDINQITWHDNTPVISNADIIAKQAELQVTFDAKQYQRDRTSYLNSNRYPSIGDQLDMQYHDLVNDTTTWKDAIKAIKDQYPKE
tara:strand:- start:354 stop:671 length:318 start_codon:yes stop_codon:yes gene_type:complete